MAYSMDYRRLQHQVAKTHIAEFKKYNICKEGAKAHVSEKKDDKREKLLVITQNTARNH